MHERQRSVSANCPTTTTINYGSYAGLIGTGTNSTIFCFNCHRADVYTFGTYGTDRCDFSRVPHPMHNTNNSGTLNGDYPAAGPPRGISCMGCHGGGGGGHRPGRALRLHANSAIFTAAIMPRTNARAPYPTVSYRRAATGTAGNAPQPRRT